MLRIFYIIRTISAIIKEDIRAEVSFAARYGLIEIFSSEKKLFACMYIDSPENETEKAIATSFVFLETKVMAEMLFAALLISRKGRNKL